MSSPAHGIRQAGAGADEARYHKEHINSTVPVGKDRQGEKMRPLKRDRSSPRHDEAVPKGVNPDCDK